MDDNRLRDERERLEHLVGASHGAIQMRVSATLRHYEFTLHVAAPVGTDEHYSVEREHSLIMDLPDDFPNSGPISKFERPILAPNIWPNGSACIVEHVWMPAQHLDQVLCDIIEMMQGLEPNFGSIANRVAGELYMRRGFQDELRRRLGPPLRLAPLPRERRSVIATVAAANPGYSTVGTAPPAPESIRTITTARTAATPTAIRSSSITTVR